MHFHSVRRCIQHAGQSSQKCREAILTHLQSIPDYVPYQHQQQARKSRAPKQDMHAVPLCARAAVHMPGPLPPWTPCSRKASAVAEGTTSGEACARGDVRIPRGQAEGGTSPRQRSGRPSGN
eukprot:2409244-Alexandrium_andersonii.AAC.1